MDNGREISIMDIPATKRELCEALKKHHIEGHPELLKLSMFLEYPGLSEDYKSSLKKVIERGIDEN